MKNKELLSNCMLLMAAAIWGFAFVAQRVGIGYVGSFTLNGVRFALGSISLIPLIVFFNRKQKGEKKAANKTIKAALPAGIIAGSVLFSAASLQQIGLYDTSVGKAAFITGLYIALVPIFGIFLKHKVNLFTWLGVIFSVTGLYFLTVNGGFSITRGDLLEIAGAFFWAIHILLIDYFVEKVDALKLSFVQFVTCSVISMIIAVCIEKITIAGLYQALIPILYTGICSVGGGYTLQVLGQKNSKPSHAAIILSFETVFASIGGALILHESLSLKGYFGCALMMAGMILSQAHSFNGKKEKEEEEKLEEKEESVTAI